MAIDAVELVSRVILDLDLPALLVALQLDSGAQCSLNLHHRRPDIGINLRPRSLPTAGLLTGLTGRRNLRLGDGLELPDGKPLRHNPRGERLLRLFRRQTQQYLGMPEADLSCHDPGLHSLG